MPTYEQFLLPDAGEGLTEEHCPDAPLEIVRAWVAAAIQRQHEHGDVAEPTAMAVAVPLAIPASWLAARWIAGLIDRAEGR